MLTMAKVLVLDSLEKEMLEIGFDKMRLYDKNQLVVNIGTKKDIPYTSITEKDVLDYHKELKANILSQKCEDDILVGFTSEKNGHHYRMNRDDQINMASQKEMVNNDTSILEVSWKTEDAGYINHTRQEWIDIYQEAFNHKKETLTKYDLKKSEILKASTHEEVISIKWIEDSKVESNPSDQLPAE